MGLLYTYVLSFNRILICIIFYHFVLSWGCPSVVWSLILVLSSTRYLIDFPFPCRLVILIIEGLALLEKLERF